MKYHRLNRSVLAANVARLLLALLLVMISQAGAPRQGSQAAGPRVAYVYGSHSNITADKFNTALSGRGVTVDLYSDDQAALATTTFTLDQTIIIGDDLTDTGGNAAFDNIYNSGKPVVAIGQRGLLFLTYEAFPFVISGTGTISATAYNVHIADPSAPVWSTPNPISRNTQDISLFNSLSIPVNAIGEPETIQNMYRIGRLIGDPNHYPLISEDFGGRCYSYWGYRGGADQLTPSGLNLFYNFILGTPCAEVSRVLNANSGTAPTMDGVLTYGEWALTPNLLEMDHGFMVAANDFTRLYLLVDMLESNLNNSGGADQNDFWVTFDTNHNGVIDPGVDMNYAMEGMTHNMRYQHYLAPANWELLSASTKSSLGPGFGCYAPDQTYRLNINTQVFECDNHQIWEIAIDLHEIGALPGQTLQMGIRSHSPNPSFNDEVPNAFDVDFSHLINLHLSSAGIPPHNPNANIAFANPPLEVTQVVQDINNSIPLIADKPTVGRVSVNTTGANTPQPVLEYLYGQRGGYDLPGSPLIQLVNAPLAVNRTSLNDTANFLLPPSWTTSGDVTYRAEASDFNGHNIAAADKALIYNHKAVPVYWFIQENMAAPNANPDLIAQSSINLFESYVKTVFPVPDVTFVQKPWTVLGALNNATLSNNVAAVEAYYSAMSAVYWTAIMQNKQPPFALPDQIFGAANIGGGLSDPTWSNSPGHAAAGGNATSGQGVAAHEFNHNLDRSSSGTWGRHVSDPATMKDSKGNTVPVNNPKWGCGAAGPDQSWPFNNDDTIHEVGFDTRLPWSASGSQLTVVPSSYPDLMSYCTSPGLPTKWISPYRYKAWIASPTFPNSLILAPEAANAAPVASLYLTGALAAGGTGQLNPVLFAPGQPITPSPSGAYSIQVLYSGGSVTHSFDVSFSDIEGQPLPTFFFNFVLPDPGSVTSVRLLHGASVLDTLTKSAAAPQPAFTSPSAGATLSGTANLTWTLSDADTPLADLRQQIQYSADNGSTWTPVAIDLPGTLTSYPLDTSLLARSSQGKLRLWVSDGLNNVTADSPGGLNVPNHPPLVNILSPAANIYLPPATPIQLSGQASDVDELIPLPGPNYLWTLDGGTVLGFGPDLPATLPNGLHTLTLKVTDRDGGSASASVTVFVNLHRVLLPVIGK